MKVLLFQLDGKIPNIALMRISAHHKALGDEVRFRWTGSPERELFDGTPDRVYGSAIFTKTKPAVDRLRCQFPDAIIGGTGTDNKEPLEARGITTLSQDYSIYPKWKQSIGFSHRGCTQNCWFCVVPWKEGAWRFEQDVTSLWRGDPWPKELILLDNDFFGYPKDKDGKPLPPIWPKQIEAIRKGGFKVSFNQGINVRTITDEAAAAIASVDFRDDSMKTKRIYCAWDNRKDEKRLFLGLERLTKHGVKPDQIMVYMLIGADHTKRTARPFLTEDDFHRREQLRAFGARPYPMPLVRTRELMGFQRWIIGAYDKRIDWKDWVAAKYQPANLSP